MAVPIDLRPSMVAQCSPNAPVDYVSAAAPGRDPVAALRLSYARRLLMSQSPMRARSVAFLTWIRRSCLPSDPDLQFGPSLASPCHGSISHGNLARGSGGATPSGRFREPKL